MILVTGATGNFGAAAIEHLLNKGINPSDIGALVRDEQKASDLKSKGVTIKIGDYNDFDSLVSAFTGVDKLLFVSGSDIAARVPQHENIVKAAKKAGVPYIIYTSFLSTNETETSPIAMVAEAHLKTEQWIKDSGMEYTFLKNNIYLDFIPVFAGEQLLDTGMIYQPAGDGKCAYALRSEMAEVAANILTSEGHYGKAYKMSGEESVSYHDIAKIISEATGKTIHYVSPTPQEFSKTLTEAGVPAEYVGMFTGFSVAKAENEFDLPATDMETLLGRKPTSVQTFLTQVYSQN